MVLHRHPHPKLLPLRPLRPQLAIPLVLAARAPLRHRPSRRLFLHRCLGGLPLPLRSAVHLPFLDPACLRHGAWRAAMGADVVGNEQHWAVCAVGWGAGGECGGGEELVVVVGGVGCVAGCRYVCHQGLVDRMRRANIAQASA